MAIFNPPIELIKKIKPYPTPGEQFLLNYLYKNLDDTFEIFFQPFLNGDRPDIIILRKSSGAHIIEVKDWNTKHYYIDNNADWRLKEDDTHILSPFEQVLKYKNNLYNLHIKELNETKYLNIQAFGLVSCSVYFHNEITNDIKSFVNQDNLLQNSKHQEYIKYFEIYGNDFVTGNRINNLINRYHLNISRTLFTEKLYNSFKRYLQAPFHSLEDGKEILYTKEQTELTRSEVSPRRKVKGFAGCGKTIVLAKRAVNAHIRTNSKILILTYNIALRNYIHDKINEVRENFYWCYFDIVNYHQFFLGNATNFNLPIKGLSEFENPKFFESVKHKITKYEVILIDEIQDYQTEWLRLIHDYYLIENGEFAVFGDEKQNIYNRKLDENKEPVTIGIRSVYNRSLKKSFRFTPEISKLVELFQKEVFKEKYNLDIIEVPKQEEFDYYSKIEYYFSANSLIDLLSLMFDILIKYSIQPSDVAILSSTVGIIRELEYSVRKQKNENTTRMFESKEEYDNIKNDYTTIEENGNVS
ncbi:MAG: NERD domain-containing protein, partial [Ignavibacteriae bacterium]|nr:NERD domain-containing protein [Ignavibacteriota bacterium]